MNRAYKKRIALSKEHIDIETRAIVRKLAHHSDSDILQLLKERSLAPDLNYFQELLREFRA